MTRTALALLTATLLVAPAWAQDWGSDYNQGIIGVLGGTESGGTISIDCADSGNGVVAAGDFSIFLNPAAGKETVASEHDTLSFEVDGTVVELPVAGNGGDGFVYEKTPATLDHATDLVDLLETGQELVVTAGGSEIARISLDGAGAALDGVDVCLVP